MPRAATTAPMAHPLRLRLERYAESQLPTEYGDLRCVVFTEPKTGLEHVALYSGDIRGAEGLLTRVHSECLTGEVFHSLKCDCSEQLDMALKRTVEARFGHTLHHGYGLSEYAGALCLGRLCEHRDDTSAGYLVEGADLRIVDPECRDLPAGERGEIWMRGVGLMPGYFRDPAAWSVAAARMS